MKNYIFLLLLLGFCSCHQNEIIDEKEFISIQKRSLSENEIHNNRVRFAIAVEKAIKNVEFKMILVEEAKKQINKDYDIVYDLIKEKTLSNGLSVADLLASTEIDNPNLRSNPHVNFYLNTLSLTDPTLTLFLFIPEDSDISDFDVNTIPIVSIIPQSFNVSTQSFIDKINSDGTTTPMSGTIDPTEFTFVTKKNERLIALDENYLTVDGSTTYSSNSPAIFNMYYVSSGSYYDLYDGLGVIHGLAPITPNTVPGPPPSAGGPGAPPSGPCVRETNPDRDNLHSFQFVDCASLENVSPWIDGKVELRLDVIYTRLINGTVTIMDPLTKIITKERSEVRDWGGIFSGCENTLEVETDIETVQWDKFDMGTEMIYNWAEVNEPLIGSGTTISIPFQIGGKITPGTSPTGIPFNVGATINLTFNNKTTQCGESIVYYCDDTSGDGKDYNTGTIEFWVNQQ